MYNYLTHYFVIAWCFVSGAIPCEPQVTLNPCTGVTLCATAWVWHLPNDLNSASVPSASLCLFCNHHFYLSFIASAWHITDIFYAISSLADFSSHSASSSPAIPTKTTTTTTDGWNRGPLQFIIINAFAVFLTVKGEAPAPPLSHDHLPVQPPGASRGPGEGSLLFWHASTLPTFLATATAPPTCRAPVAMAARCSQRTLKTHTSGSTQTARHSPICCTTLLFCLISSYHFHPALISRLLYLCALPTKQIINRDGRWAKIPSFLCGLKNVQKHRPVSH